MGQVSPSHRRCCLPGPLSGPPIRPLALSAPSKAPSCALWPFRRVPWFPEAPRLAANQRYQIVRELHATYAPSIRFGSIVVVVVPVLFCSYSTQCGCSRPNIQTRYWRRRRRRRKRRKRRKLRNRRRKRKKRKSVMVSNIFALRYACW